MKFEQPTQDNKIDPNKNSILETNISLTKLTNDEKNKINDKTLKFYETKVFEEEKTGEKFFEKNKLNRENEEDVRVEHFVSLLTKGILRSSDIVKKDDKFFSRKLELENMEIPEKGELEAELFLLDYLFADADKLIFDINSIGVKSSNVNINKEGNFSHYDYGHAFSSNPVYSSFGYDDNSDLMTKKINIHLDYIKKYGQSHDKPIERNRFQKMFNIKAKSPEAEELLLKKTHEIIDRLNDSNFFKAIIKKSEIEQILDKNNPKKMFQFLKTEDINGRVEELRHLMAQRLEILVNILETRKIA